MSAITIPANNSASMTALVRTGTGAVQDVTNWLFQFRVRNPPDPRTGQQGSILFDKLSSTPGQIVISDGPAGKVIVFINPADIPAAGQFKYEFKGTDTNGSSYTLNGPADFNVTPTLI